MQKDPVEGHHGSHLMTGFLSKQKAIDPPQDSRHTSQALSYLILFKPRIPQLPKLFDYDNSVEPIQTVDMW